jgi:peroxiredoxin
MAADTLKFMASKREKRMLTEGAKAPDFDLEQLTGGRRTLPEAAGGNPVLLAFFKVSCPTCQFAFPFLERLYRQRANREIGMYAISQDDAESTREFHSEFGVSMPTLLDKEDEEYPASNAYGLTTVPSLFLIEPDGRIARSIMGFDKRGLEELGGRLGADPFLPGEYVPEWKSG